MNKETLKTHALMLLNMYGVKEQDIKDRPECLNVFLNEILEQPKEKWEDRFDKYRLYFVGDESFNRAKDFIRETLANERMKIRDECYGWANDAYEQAVKEERNRILKALPKEKEPFEYLPEIFGIKSDFTADGYNECLEEVKKILTN
jgi:hypothetical protein